MNLSDYTLIPKGFTAAGKHIGIKKANKDLSIIVSEAPCVASGLFTTNIVKAAPVLWDQEIISSGKKVRAIVTNSGNANACTGKQGIDDTRQMAQTLAQATSCNEDEVLVCSTGVIGVNLNMDIVTPGIKAASLLLGNTPDDLLSASEAITTTDTFIKTASLQCDLGGQIVTLFGMAKGSGMIHPNMATMLSYVITDCNIEKEALDCALKHCVSKTFNMISVDGDTSTNDTILVLANGMAGNQSIKTSDAYYEAFAEALMCITKKLSTDVVRDGEGASKLMEVTVFEASTYDDAVKIAKSVVSSSLFKAALFGADANWGRVLCAMGYSGGSFDPFIVDIFFKSQGGELQLMEKGAPVPFSEEIAKEILIAKEIFIDIHLNQGQEAATAWGCDLTYDYVKINGDYRS